MLELIKELFRKKPRIYSQQSGKEILPCGENKGGYVSNDGRVFAINDDMSSFYLDSMKGIFRMDYRTYSEIQRDIKEKRLIYFGRLEDVVNG